MRSVIRIVLFAVVVGLLTCPTSGSQDRKNAATWYHRAIAITNSLSMEDWNALTVFVNSPLAAPSDHVRGLLSRLSKAQFLVGGGSRQKFSNFYDGLGPVTAETAVASHPVPYSDHSLIGVPHLATMMQAQAMVQIHDGDPAAAAASLAATYRMGQHLSQDMVLSSNHTAFTILRQTSQTVQFAIDQGVFSSPDGRVMLDALRAIGPDDPLHAVDTFATQTDLIFDWFEALYESGQVDQLENYMSIFGHEDLDLHNIDENEFEELIDQASGVVDRAIELMLLDDPAEARVQLEELCSEVQESMIAGLLPAFRAQTLGGIVQIQYLDDLIGKLAGTLQGLAEEQLTIQESANAAFWYLRGTGILDQIGRDEIEEVIEAFASGSESTDSHERSESIEKARSALNQFQQGSLIRRCDFSPARTEFALELGHAYPVENRLELIPGYIPGMLEALRLFQAEVKHLLVEGRLEEAADRVATCIRMSSHLGDDPLLTSSLLAHRAFQRTIELTAAILSHDDWDEQLRSKLSSSLRWMSRKDPFGYIRSINQARRELASVFMDLNETPDVAEKDAIREGIRGWNADQLVFGLVVFETLKSARSSETANATFEAANAQAALNTSEQWRESIENEGRLSDIISLAELRIARGLSLMLLPQLLKGNATAVTEVEVPSITEIRQLRGSARRDLRKASSLINSLSSKYAIEL